MRYVYFYDANNNLVPTSQMGYNQAKQTMENNKNNETQNRREFFKEAARKALPIIGAVALLSNPVIANAVEQDITDCNGCSNSCRGGCNSGCHQGCKSNCALNCEGQSHSVGYGCDGCKGRCMGGCSGGCSGNCSGSCSRSSYSL